MEMEFPGYMSIMIDESRTGGKFVYMGDPMKPQSLGYVYMTPEQWEEFKRKVNELD